MCSFPEERKILQLILLPNFLYYRLVAFIQDSSEFCQKMIVTCVLNFFMPSSPCHAVTFVSFCGIKNYLCGNNSVSKSISVSQRYLCGKAQYLGFSLTECLGSTLCEVPSAMQVDYAVSLCNLDTHACNKTSSECNA